MWVLKHECTIFAPNLWGNLSIYYLGLGFELTTSKTSVDFQNHRTSDPCFEAITL